MGETKWKESVCQCEACKNLCRQRPCWPTLEEAQALIDAGLGERLMCDYWVAEIKDIEILSPAIIGYESCAAPFWPFGRCTFLTDKGLCELHDLKLKPLEGRVFSCQNDPEDLHGAIAKMWDCREGKRIVSKWRTMFSEKGRIR